MTRMAIDLMSMLGIRRSDLVRLGPPNERNGWIIFTEYKGQSRQLKHREIPILPALRASIDATQCGSTTYLVTNFGKPFTSNGFGNWFRKRCNEAGLPHCTAHGLRKAGATISADNGASTHQLMAMFGWDSLKEAEVYTRKASRKRLVSDAVRLLDPKRRSGTTVPADDVVVPGGTIFARNRTQSTAGMENGAQGRDDEKKEEQ